ncbi:hypothetical protein HaLaN_18316 [Haematococcus lacustris]|uniref:Uncharacterized protein n=1 Tax=Haematococcus lacustris TaxID=44745 RepID=A0A699ZFU4_HAELA|nr:hypothetical protein HaLaN_18316 [Haematococcus lacustris]
MECTAIGCSGAHPGCLHRPDDWLGQQALWLYSRWTTSCTTQNYQQLVAQSMPSLRGHSLTRTIVMLKRSSALLAVHLLYCLSATGSGWKVKAQAAWSCSSPAGVGRGPGLFGGFPLPPRRCQLRSQPAAVAAARALAPPAAAARAVPSHTHAAKGKWQQHSPLSPHRPATNHDDEPHRNHCQCSREQRPHFPAAMLRGLALASVEPHRSCRPAIHPH